jgi:hypothetical protein
VLQSTHRDAMMPSKMRRRDSINAPVRYPRHQRRLQVQILQSHETVAGVWMTTYLIGRGGYG